MTTSTPGGVIAVIPVREGQLPLGGIEVAWEARAGLVLLMGTGCATAAEQLPSGLKAWGWDCGVYAPGGWAEQLVPLLRTAGRILLPASPDGRDLGPRVAAALGRPFVGGAAELRETVALVPRWNGTALAELPLDPFAVVTRLPGSASDAVPAHDLGATYRELTFPLAPVTPTAIDADHLELLPADPSTVDLAEARRIIAGGAGIAAGAAGSGGESLAGPAAFELLAKVAEALGLSLGATRLVADLGWVDTERYIGTTGVSVDPDLYVALGISGAVQHLTGLGDPEHIVSVNTDASCPMMARADLALVCDAQELLTALAAKLEVLASV